MLDKLFSKKGKAETPKQSQTFGDVTIQWRTDVGSASGA